MTNSKNSGTAIDMVVITPVPLARFIKNALVRPQMTPISTFTTSGSVKACMVWGMSQSLKIRAPLPTDSPRSSSTECAS